MLFNQYEVKAWPLKAESAGKWAVTIDFWRVTDKPSIIRYPRITLDEVFDSPSAGFIYGHRLVAEHSVDA